MPTSALIEIQVIAKGRCGHRPLRGVIDIKIPTPEKIRGGIQKYSTVPPWLRQMPSLIGAVMGAPIRAFPPGGSEVVSPSADLQGLSTNRPLSEQLSAARVFVTALWSKCTTIVPKSQSLWRKYPIIGCHNSVLKSITAVAYYAGLCKRKFV